MNKGAGPFALLASWLLVLAALGIYVQRELVVSSDLRLFLPSPKTAPERLLLDELGEGPASRLLIVALSHASPARLAETSRALTGALATHAEFRIVANGEAGYEAIPEALLPYRFLLTASFDREPMNAEFLRKEFVSRERDLASPAGGFLEPILPRDPTLEILHLVEHWQPAQEPHLNYDVWFDKQDQNALVLIESDAPAFDPDRQERILAIVQDAFRSTRTDPSMQIEISGVGAFSTLMKNRTQNEAQWLGTAATLGMIVLTLVAYRRLSLLVLSALPLASAGLAGLLAVAGAFDAVHGITLAFGFTLIGVAQDYPLHLLSHRHAGTTAREVARNLWPTLSTGVASTCIAYLTFFFSGVTGLAQLATFTIVGLTVAGLSTRFVLPQLLHDGTEIDYGQSIGIAAINRRLDAFPRLRGLLVVLIVASVAALILPRQPFWENDLSTLTPVPTDLLLRDQALQSELGTADVRYLFAVKAHNDGDARTRLEKLNVGLDGLVGRGAIKRYDHIAHYVPSEATQRERQQRLPNESQLRAEVVKALHGLSFRDDVFEPFVKDVAQAKRLAPLKLSDLTGSPLAPRAEMLVTKSSTGVTALITLTGVADPAALEAFARSAGDDITFLDLKSASEGLVATQRGWILLCLGVACVLLIAVIGFSLRSIQRLIKVLTPMLLTTLLAVATLRATGVSLSLFHLISLILCAGLGLDYALFFEHSAEDPNEQRRTLHAVLLCSASTLMVFALLIVSSIPVLRAIGVTVSLGVIGNFVLAFLITRSRGETNGAAAR